MRWDYKLVIYLLLTYFIYGVINLLELNNFVVPLPLSFIMAIIVSLAFIFKTKPSIYSILIIGIPLVMIKDLIIFYDEKLGITMTILGLISWMWLGLLLINYSKKNTLTRLTGAFLIMTPVLLFNHTTLTLIFISTILILSYLTLQKNILSKKNALERSLLTLSFILAMFLLNEVSIWLVS